jgi:hypothetical protein
VLAEESLVRQLSLASFVATAILVIAPTGASAGTQIGETFVPSWFCRSDTSFLQTISAGAPYTAQHDGVITTWRFQAPASGTDLLKFKVGRPAGDRRFRVVGESGLTDPVPGALNSYSIQIPVFAGDVIGFYWNAGNTDAGENVLCSKSDDGYAQQISRGDVAASTTAIFGQELGFQLDLSAILEPDCDKDGLGDETQDTSTSPCPICKGQPATIIGTRGKDVRTGTPGRDVMVGLEANDNLSGLAGNDIICGGTGKDTLNGDKGKDKLYGQKGKDTLKGGPGKDKLKGGVGKDKQVQ